MKKYESDELLWKIIKIKRVISDYDCLKLKEHILSERYQELASIKDGETSDNYVSLNSIQSRINLAKQILTILKNPSNDSISNERLIMGIEEYLINQQMLFDIKYQKLVVAESIVTECEYPNINDKLSKYEIWKINRLKRKIDTIEHEAGRTIGTAQNQLDVSGIRVMEYSDYEQILITSLFRYYFQNHFDQDRTKLEDLILRLQYGQNLINQAIDMSKSNSIMLDENTLLDISTL